MNNITDSENPKIGGEMPSERKAPGGIIHTYLRFDPVRFPSPNQPPPDMIGPAFDHLLSTGSTRRLTEEELARAVKLDPSQLANLGPSIDSIRRILEEKKRKILETHSTDEVMLESKNAYVDAGRKVTLPGKLKGDFSKALRDEQLAELEMIWYRLKDEKSQGSICLLNLMERLGEKYQIEELEAKYRFTGIQPMDVPLALEIKQILETIDRLLEQLKEAEKTAQIGLIDLDELAKFTEPEDIESLGKIQQEINELLKELAHRQGIESDENGLKLTPKAYRLFQSKILGQIFDKLQDSRSGRHPIGVEGDGAVEMAKTRPYEFGDSPTSLDLPSSFVNALVRTGGKTPIRLETRDMEVYRTRKQPRCATVVLLDMSGSMRYDGQYIQVKRMGLALEGLIHTEFPGDYLQFIEMYSFAKPRHFSEVAELMPKPVTLFDPVVRLRADMSNPSITESQIPPHFTNIQHGLSLARRFLAAQDTPNRQVILITDGLPTAHFEGQQLYLLYPPDPRTEEATLREANYCQREGIVINIFLMQTWNQTSEDVQFAYRMAKNTNGRVFFPGGGELDRYVVWDYLAQRRTIIG